MVGSARGAGGKPSTVFLLYGSEMRAALSVGLSAAKPPHGCPWHRFDRFEAVRSRTASIGQTDGELT